jgi:PAS domain S-box-containing protein
MSKRARPAPADAVVADDVAFRAVVDSMPDVVYMLDLDGRFTYLNPRAYEVFGYDPVTESFIGREVMDILAPGDTAPAIGAIRRRAETPHDRQIIRVEARRKDGSAIPLEIHGGPVWRDGHVVGRVGVCRVLDASARADGATGHGTPANLLQEERMRIARGLRDAIAQIVFGVTADRDASESFLSDVKRATRADLARRLRLDDVDLEILRLVAAGASNREIGAVVHLSAAAIKDRMRRLMDRLGARRRAELAAHALRLGVA